MWCQNYPFRPQMASSKRALPKVCTTDAENNHFSTSSTVQLPALFGVFCSNTPDVSEWSPASHGFVTGKQKTQRFATDLNVVVMNLSRVQFLNKWIHFRVLRCLFIICILITQLIQHICTHTDIHMKSLTCSACSHFNTITCIYN